MSMAFCVRARHRAAWLIIYVAASSPLVAAPLTFSDAMAAAERTAPSLAAQNAQLDATRQSAIAAGRLPDPKLFASIENLPINGPDRYSLTDDFMTMRKVGIMQEIPNGRLRQAQHEGAQAAIESAEDDIRIEQLKVRRETALAWIARYTVERQLERLDELVVENRLLADTVRAQLVGGQGKSIDAVLPRQEAAMLEARRDELVRAREQAIAALVRWVGPDGQEAVAGDLPNWHIARETLMHQVHQHPELIAFEAKTRLAQAQVHEAEADKHPSWGVEFGYARRGPIYSDMVTIQVSVTLPLFPGSRQNPQIAAKHAELSRLDAEREGMLREHAELLNDELAEFQQLDRALVRQQQIIIPLAEEKVSLAMAAYRANKGDLTDVVAARREQAEAHLKEIELTGQRAQRAARIVYMYGDNNR
jgi:cobalt-zinc-cadmium efflux system outer membrane protein